MTLHRPPLTSRNLSAACLLFGMLLTSPLHASEPTAEIGSMPLESGEFLLTRYPAYKKAYLKYHPSPESLQQISTALSNESLEVHAFYYIWCRDSKREIPRLLKLADLINEPKTASMHVQLIPLDSKNKRLDGGKEMHIQRTPTFILYQSGKEIGRIEERARPHIAGALEHILLVPAESSPIKGG
ncbi:MAG: thioredoxin family protein [Gammaproteobacteria bacterium]